MPKDLKTWLREMPPESEIDGRIGDLESELELLRAIKQVRAHSPAAESSQPQARPEIENKNGALPPEVLALRSRLSDQRERILRAILAQRNGRATIPDVVAAVDPNDRANIASNMQRMVKARLLARVGRGRYGLTPAAKQLMHSISTNNGGPDL
jgi:hypothetical protein